MTLFQRSMIMILALSLLALAGCTERQKQEYSHWKSDVVGLKRTVTLYDANGKSIKTWNGRFKVEITGNTARFIADAKTIIISGTFVIEEN